MSRHLVIFIGLIALLTSPTHLNAAERGLSIGNDDRIYIALERALGLCRNQPKEFESQMKEVEEKFFDYVTQSPSVLTDKGDRNGDKSIQPGFIVELARHVWPYALPENYPARMVYVACSVPLEKMRDAIVSNNSKAAKTYLHAWKKCIHHSYQSETPQAIKLLQQCYEHVVDPPVENVAEQSER